MREREFYVNRIVQLVNEIKSSDVLRQIYITTRKYSSSYKPLDKTNKCSV